ncbi:MAG TPA: hypothetical protein VKB22_00215 [Gemmatimonadales bacterium]|nr:hypothetical protein [Gemmatimonadales bacterium]
MYRIELSPGEETVFRSIEELAVAIRRGVVTPRARIFHNASSKWLPIQFHPHYKTAVSMPLTQAALVAGPQAKPLSSLTLDLPPEPTPEPEMTLPASEPRVLALPKPAAQKKKRKSKELTGESRSRRRSKPRRQLRIALIGALLIGGAQWVLSVPLVSRAKPTLLIDVRRRLTEVHANSMGQVASPNSADMIPALPASASAAIPEVLQQAAEPRHRVTAPSFGGTSTIGLASREIEPAPPASDLPVAALGAADSLSPKLADSTGQKAMQGILTTVSGGATSAIKPPPKR